MKSNRTKFTGENGAHKGSRLTAPIADLGNPVMEEFTVQPASGLKKFWSEWKQSIARPVNGSSLAFFRMAVAIVMMLEAWSLTRPSASTNGRIMLDTYYAGQDIHFHFPYPWFEWVPVLPSSGMHLLVGLLGFASLLLAIGLCYRVAASIVFCIWGYFYVIESTRTYWMSYYYLELLVTFLLIWMPAARVYSVDAWMIRKWWRKPRADKIPNGCLILLRLQLAIAYFYAGVAKLNSDWLINAVPMKNFLETAASHHFVNIAWVQGLLHSVSVAYGLSYAGAAFDLAVGFMLLSRRTRRVGFVLLVLFHAINHFILFDDIIWFPLLGIATATIFFEPDWPCKMNLLRATEKKVAAPKSQVAPTLNLRVINIAAVCIAGWLVVQILVPIRHFFIQGDGRFTWEGLPFSWRLKTELYSAAPCEIFVHDPAIASGNVVNWNAWNGERCIYRRIDPEHMDWQSMPEVVPIFEPEIGERIIYNPYAGVSAPRSEPESIQRVNAIWREVYQRAPRSIRPVTPMNEVVNGYIEALQRKGVQPESRDMVIRQIFSVHGKSGSGQMIPFLRRVEPFGTQFKNLPSGRFMLVEDAGLIENATGRVPKIMRSNWKGSAYSDNSGDKYTSGAPLVIYNALNIFERYLLPQKSLFASDRGVSVSWDYLQDATVSQGMHMSMQPFLLRRYARRVEDLWFQEYERKAAVTAVTSVSLNGRKSQMLVDPQADLADVGVRWWGHNSWIYDLQR